MYMLDYYFFFTMLDIAGNILTIPNGEVEYIEHIKTNSNKVSSNEQREKQ